MLRLLKNNKELSIIVLAAFLLRVTGFWHGFPIIFNVDEPALVRSAMSLRFELNPRHFDWPHLHFYLNYFIYVAYLKFRGFFLDSAFLRETVLWREPVIFYLITRIFNAFLGALTIIPIYHIAKNLADKRAGIFAALLFAVFVLHVRASHFALIDVPTTFWLAFSVLFASKALTHPSYSNYLLSGLFAGFAMSTKYNGLFASLSLAATHLIFILRDKTFLATKEFYLKPMLAVVVCIGGFLLGTPYALIDYKTFSRTDGYLGAFWQFTNVGSASFGEHILNFFIYSPLTLIRDLGYTPFLLFLCFIAYGLFHILRTKSNTQNRTHLERLLFIAVPALLIIYNVSGYEKTRSHYFMPSYTFIALGGGMFLASIARSKRHMQVAMLSLAIPLTLSLYQVFILSIKDTRILAYEYLQRARPSTLIYKGEEFKEAAVRFKSTAKVVKLRRVSDIGLYTAGHFVLTNPVKAGPLSDMPYSVPFPKVMNIANKFRNGPEIDIYFLSPILYEAN
jgi:4-amino-4-deoxy-L-arabinose transferase-like glycosyltransferase